ncbi:MAG: metal ABC transporter permease [Thermodesulfobacteriota bacterium]
MWDILSLEFMQNAIWASLLVSLVCGIVGSLVVVNRMVFLAGGVAHTAYGGVGIAIFWGLPVMPTTIAFTLLAALGIASATVGRKFNTDTVIGIFWATGMALGIILMDLSPGYRVDLMSYLFGSILSVPGIDIWIMGAVDIVVLALVLLLYKNFLAITFDQEFARTRGVPVTGLYFLLMVMIALSVVMIIRLVGLILVIALLTIPPYLAQRRANSLGKMMFLAVLWSIFFCLAGLFIAYQFNLTSGATIVGTGAICLSLMLGWEQVKKAISSYRVQYR